ncbi:hypothetical protein [Pseudomonas sp. CC120222-01a]|uniref:hypothetical protein n=1 Tax=Pseudomonas sp. CC120222-01a TaxID=1378075 RepID=UPI000D918E53|nr:hypothetical protein [Pseudomonas sp. CC120222-01a]PVZ42971.1 hypothetical protein N430_00657 [Pseudomonas sp. CC120222-01a]
MLAPDQLVALLLEVLDLERCPVGSEPGLAGISLSPQRTSCRQELAKGAMLRVCAKKMVGLLARSVQAWAELCLQLIDRSDSSLDGLGLAEAGQ